MATNLQIDNQLLSEAQRLGNFKTKRETVDQALNTVSVRERVIALMCEGQEKLVTAFEAIDGKAKFQPHTWQHYGGGGGTAMVLENGKAFEKAGLNTSATYGAKVPASLAKQHPGIEGKPYFATGISMVLHPQNPYVPAFHANYRYFEVEELSAGDGISLSSAKLSDNGMICPAEGSDNGMICPAEGSDNGMICPAEGSDNGMICPAEGSFWWFGGGADMTPSYGFEEDAVHFHKTLQAQCDRHAQADYDLFKKTCDDYFLIKHRHEMRGIGGIFFDELSSVGQGDWGKDFAFVQDGIETILTAYLPIVKKRMIMPYSKREKEWQLYRRGRYVEFNLVYDRGTTFGLQTSGNIEAILMSMPPYARWEFDYKPEPGSAEEKVLEFLQPRNWLL
jgi:coproporphyrinogen III oxidase